MIGVHGIPVGDRIEVKTIHYNLDSLPEANKAKFTMVESLPEEPAPVKGKRNVLYLDPKTNVLTYEQKDRPLHPEEAMADLAVAMAEQNTLMSAKLDQLIQLQTEANNLAKGV